MVTARLPNEELFSSSSCLKCPPSIGKKHPNLFFPAAILTYIRILSVTRVLMYNYIYQYVPVFVGLLPGCVRVFTQEIHAGHDTAETSEKHYGHPNAQYLQLWMHWWEKDKMSPNVFHMYWFCFWYRWILSWIEFYSLTGIFEKHKLLFSFQITCKLEQDVDNIKQEELDFFIKVWRSCARNYTVGLITDVVIKLKKLIIL